MMERRFEIQKQPLADVLGNRCSYKFHNVYRKILELESLSYKAAGLQAYNSSGGVFL